MKLVCISCQEVFATEDVVAMCVQCATEIAETLKPKEAQMSLFCDKCIEKIENNEKPDSDCKDCGVNVPVYSEDDSKTDGDNVKKITKVVIG